MTSRTAYVGFRAIRRDQLREDHEHDAYRRPKKPAEPAFCPDCQAVFHGGRWQWGERAQAATGVRCPACARIHDRFPAGYVHVGGAFFAAHRDEIVGLLDRHAKKAAAEHALARVIAVDNDAECDDGIVLTTTDIHLARDLGEALHAAYRGELEYLYNDSENLLRVHWQR